jgi:tetratricopeptide (TPR) repeat protein
LHKLSFSSYSPPPRAEWLLNVITGVGTFLYLCVAMRVAPKYKLWCGIALALCSVFFSSVCFSSTYYLGVFRDPDLETDGWRWQISCILSNTVAGLLACLLERSNRVKTDSFAKLLKESETASPQKREALLQKIRAHCDQNSELYHRANLQLAEVFRVSKRYFNAEQLAGETANYISKSTTPKKQVVPLKQTALRELARIFKDQGRLGEAHEFYMQALTYSGSDCVNPIDTAGLLREANELAAQLKAQLDAQQHASDARAKAQIIRLAAGDSAAPADHEVVIKKETAELDA